ncbi:MAG: hypothetical protein AAGF12_22500 [Myxococcota bacterium]
MNDQWLSEPTVDDLEMAVTELWYARAAAVVQYDVACAELRDKTTSLRTFLSMCSAAERAAAADLIRGLEQDFAEEAQPDAGLDSEEAA